MTNCTNHITMLIYTFYVLRDIRFETTVANGGQGDLLYNDNPTLL